MGLPKTGCVLANSRLVAGFGLVILFYRCGIAYFVNLARNESEHERPNRGRYAEEREQGRCRA